MIDPAYTSAAEAEAAFDWPAAIALYEEALSSLDRSDQQWPAREADLLIALGRSYWRNAEARPAWRTLMRAITSCRQRGDGVAQARATLEILKIWGPWERHKMLGEDALEALSDADPYLRAFLLWSIDRRDEAFALAEKHGYEDLLAFRRSQQGWDASREGRLDEARAIAQEMHVAYDRLGNWEMAANGLRGIGFSAMLAGDLTQGESILQQSCEYAAKYHLRFFEQLALMDIIGAKYAQCDWAECDRLLDSMEGGSDFRIDLFRMWIAELRGDADRARSLLVDPQRAGGSGDGLAQVHSARAGALYRMGEHGAARAELEVMFRSADGDHQDLNHYVPACVDAIVALCDDATIRMCIERTNLSASAIAGEATGDGEAPHTDRSSDLSPDGESRVEESSDLSRDGDDANRSPSDSKQSDDLDRPQPAPYIYSTLQGRSLYPVRGALSLRIGDLAAATQHFTDGIAWSARERCPLEAAACHDGLATIATHRNDTTAADHHRASAEQLRAAHQPQAAPK